MNIPKPDIDAPPNEFCPLLKTDCLGTRCAWFVCDESPVDGCCALWQMAINAERLGNLMKELVQKL